MNTAEKLESSVNWSPYQNSVFDWVAKPDLRTSQHLVIEALAGSGKSTTVVEAIQYTPENESVLFVAFNAAIVKALESRLPSGASARTCHSYGLRQITAAFGNRKVEPHACEKRISTLYPELAAWKHREIRTAIAKVVALGKGTLRTNYDSLDHLIDYYGIVIPKSTDRYSVIESARAVLAATAADTRGSIDYDDMIWLPVVRELACTQFNWVFVDETQDLNACQLELVRLAYKESGHIVAVGDRHQAIYGFRGADSEAIPRMISELKADVLPLSITYRCPVSVVEEAQAFVPEIECAEGAELGSVLEKSYKHCCEQALPGDFIISRTNAPLIKLCYYFLRNNRPAMIRGRDIGRDLAAWLAKFEAPSIPALIACVRSWEAAEVERLTALDRDTDKVHARADCAYALTEGHTEIATLLTQIETLFNDVSPTNAILLSSTHKVKGLEADRVWMLCDTYRDDTQEEKNLQYVAITRAKKELFYVGQMPDAYRNMSG